MIMISDYYDDCWEVKPSFSKEFISLWPGWLGESERYKLDEVTENEWSKFNLLIKTIHSRYQIINVDLPSNSFKYIDNVEEILFSYKESMEKESKDFSRLILPEFECILTEEWDCTFILYYKNNNVKEVLLPIIKEVGLFHFK